VVVRADDQAVCPVTGDDLAQRRRALGQLGAVVDHVVVDPHPRDQVGGQIVALEDRLQALERALVADEQATFAGEMAIDRLAHTTPPEHRGGDECHADDDCLVLAGGSAEKQLIAEPDGQDEQRAELSDSRQLFDRRLADALVIALVEPEDLGCGDDRGDQQQCERGERVRRRGDHGAQQRKG